MSPATATEDVTSAEVVSWFDSALKGQRVPTEAMVRQLTLYINLPRGRQLVIPQRRHPDLAALAEAVAVILAIAPKVVKVAESHERYEAEHNPGTEFERIEKQKASALRALVLAARHTAPWFPARRPQPGRARARWHGLATAAAEFVSGAMRQAGHRNVKFTAVRGPAVEVLRQVMGRIEGQYRKPAQLVEPFRKLGR